MGCFSPFTITHCRTWFKRMAGEIGVKMAFFTYIYHKYNTAFATINNWDIYAPLLVSVYYLHKGENIIILSYCY